MRTWTTMLWKESAILLKDEMLKNFPPNIKIYNTLQLYRIMENSRWGSYDHSWAEYHGFTDPDSLRTILNEPLTYPHRNPSVILPDDSYYFRILYAKKCKLWGRIYTAIENLIEMFQNEFYDASELNFKYDITQRTYEKLAMEICYHIHPTALEYYEDDEQMDWIPTIDNGPMFILKHPIEYIDSKFIDPKESTELEEFHNERHNEDAMYESLQQHLYHDIFMEKFMPKEIILALNECANYHKEEDRCPEFKEWVKVLNNTESWEI